MYTCNARIIQLDQTRNVVGVSQNHEDGLTDQDVKALVFHDQHIDFFPEDINVYFTNLEIIVFFEFSIKSFTRNDLRPFPELKVFGIAFGQITTINGDVFKYSPNLQYVDFNNNQITNVGPGIFQHSPKLTEAHFSNNMCIDNSAFNATGVAVIARELSFRCPPTVEMTEEIILEGENFQEAVNDQVEPEIMVIDGRVDKLEEGSGIMTNKQEEKLTRVQ